MSTVTIILFAVILFSIAGIFVWIFSINERLNDHTKAASDRFESISNFQRNQLAFSSESKKRFSYLEKLLNDVYISTSKNSRMISSMNSKLIDHEMMISFVSFGSEKLEEFNSVITKCLFGYVFGGPKFGVANFSIVGLTNEEIETVMSYNKHILFGKSGKYKIMIKDITDDDEKKESISSFEVKIVENKQKQSD